MKNKVRIGTLSNNWQPEPQHNGPPVTRYFLQPDSEEEPQGIVISQKDKIIYVKLVSPDGMLERKTLKGSNGCTVFSFRLVQPSKVEIKKSERKVVVAKPVVAKVKEVKKAPVVRKSKRKAVTSKHKK